MCKIYLELINKINIWFLLNMARKNLVWRELESRKMPFSSELFFRNLYRQGFRVRACKQTVYLQCPLSSTARMFPLKTKGLIHKCVNEHCLKLYRNEGFESVDEWKTLPSIVLFHRMQWNLDIHFLKKNVIGRNMCSVCYLLSECISPIVTKSPFFS